MYLDDQLSSVLIQGCVFDEVRRAAPPLAHRSARVHVYTWRMRPAKFTRDATGDSLSVSSSLATNVFDISFPVVLRSVLPWCRWGVPSATGHVPRSRGQSCCWAAGATTNSSATSSSSPSPRRPIEMDARGGLGSKCVAAGKLPCSFLARVPHNTSKAWAKYPDLASILGDEPCTPNSSTTGSATTFLEQPSLRRGQEFVARRGKGGSLGLGNAKQHGRGGLPPLARTQAGNPRDGIPATLKQCRACF